MTTAEMKSIELMDQKDLEANPEPPVVLGEEPVKELGLIDKYLSLWIIIACGIGLGLGQVTAVLNAIKATSVGTTNVLVAIGLIFMIYPPLAKVEWIQIGDVFKDKLLLGLTLFMNWIFGPFLMFFLSVAFFRDYSPRFMTGLSLVGIARCIAMVLVWNDLAGGSAEYCAAIVALNSLMTVALYPPLTLFFVVTLPKQMFEGRREWCLRIFPFIFS